MVLAVIMMAVAVIIALVITVVILTACWVIDPRNPTDFFPMALVGLLSISVLVGNQEHLTDRDWWFPIKLHTELIVMIEPVDEIGNHFGF